MQPGSLLICVNVDTKNNNSNWKGILPIVGEYYTCREIDILGHKDTCYVEEIVSDKVLWKGLMIEYAHNKKWYKEAQPPIDLTELLKEEIDISNVTVNVNEFGREFSTGVNSGKS